MDYKKMRIVFLGTPLFAKVALQKLVSEGCLIVGVITAPDKPAGRGLQLQTSEVKTYALSQNLPILQPPNLKNENFIADLRALKADLQVVVAFRMLPEIVWNMPPLGTMNLHGSLLPQYRGAAPIQWAIMNGEKITGVTTFLLKHQIDTGDILLQEEVEIRPQENAGDLHDKMAIIGANLLVQSIKAIAEKSIQPINQRHYTLVPTEPLHHATKITPELCLINWATEGEKIINKIRGLAPFPAAYTFLNNKKLKIYQAFFEPTAISELSVGQFVTDNKTFLKLKAKDGFVHIIMLQAEGKKKMDIVAFLNGNKL